MDSTMFSVLLGVHPSTVYRWEGHGEKEVKIEPMQLKIIALIDRQLSKKIERKERDRFLKRLKDELLIGGCLRGLFVILSDAFG